MNNEFNKRYVDSRKILIYKDRLENLFTDKIDAFFFNDDFQKKYSTYIMKKV